LQTGKSCNPCSTACRAVRMATMLPAIKQPVSKPLGNPQRSLLVAPSDKATNKTKLTGYPVVVVRHKTNKKEHELQERRLAARAKLPDLTEWQTDK